MGRWSSPETRKMDDARPLQSIAILVSGGSTNNFIQVLTLLMAAVHGDVKARVLFRDESVFRLTPSAINTPELSAAFGRDAGGVA